MSLWAGALCAGQSWDECSTREWYNGGKRGLTCLLMNDQIRLNSGVCLIRASTKGTGALEPKQVQLIQGSERFRPTSKYSLSSNAILQVLWLLLLKRYNEKGFTKC